jgi:hypothetical protein
MDFRRQRRRRSAHVSSRENRHQSVALPHQDRNLSQDQWDQIRPRLSIPHELKGKVSMVTNILI